MRKVRGIETNLLKKRDVLWRNSESSINRDPFGNHLFCALRSKNDLLETQFKVVVEIDGLGLNPRIICI